MDKARIAELVDATIAAGKANANAWWITRHGTILCFKPDVVIWIAGGKGLLKFGIGMPPVYGPGDIAGIPLSRGQRSRLWDAFKNIQDTQKSNAVTKALATVGL